MQPSIGEKVIGPATPARPHSPSNRHHQLDLPLPLQNRSVMTARSTSYSSTLTESENKLTELEVVLERNKVKVAVIQESKLSPKSKNPCIQNYTTVRIAPMVKEEDCGSSFTEITFSKQTSSPESLSDPHLEELSIKAELGNTKLIISNVYIPPASSCSNGYHSSIEHLPTTPDTLILGDFNAHHPSWYSTDTKGRKIADSINGSDYGILTGTAPQEFRQMLNRVRQMSH